MEIKKHITIVLLLFSFSVKGQDSTLLKFIDKWIGKPYRYGGESEKGIDCSAFVQRLYKDVYNLIIPRTCRYQFQNAKLIDLNEIKIGDLLFFNSKVSPSGWHVGVYIGEGAFIHAANYKDGVKISCLDDYLKIFKGIGRYENSYTW